MRQSFASIAVVNFNIEPRSPRRRRVNDGNDGNEARNHGSVRRRI